MSFTRLGFNVGAIIGVKAVTMTQGALIAKNVSTPSWRRSLAALIIKGFSTSYTG